MIIDVTKNINEYIMASVKYDDKFFVLPWEEIFKNFKIEYADFKDITYCVNKNTVTFTLIFKDKSLVVVFNAENGSYDYILEGKYIIKAVLCSDKIIGVAKITSEWGMSVILKCTSLIGSSSWEYESLNIKKQSYENDADDYELIVAGNDAFINICNPYNEAEYMKYVEENFSIYGLYDYWKDKDINTFENNSDKNTIHIEFSSGDPLTLNITTYCSDPRFAAGYLKYIVLGDAAYMLLLTDSEKDRFLQKDDKELENDYIPNIDYILNKIIRPHSNKKNIMCLFEEMVELCDIVIMERDNKKAVDFLLTATEKCNTYFDKHIFPETGYNYQIKTYME